ncbi:MAG: O-antigen ligase family protein [Candidatus Wallbacteria bacterium]
MALQKQSKNITNENGIFQTLFDNFKFSGIEKYFFISAVFLTFLIFTTFNTTAFLAPKSFFIRFCMILFSMYFVYKYGACLKKCDANFPLFCAGLALAASTLVSHNMHISLFRISEYFAYFIIFLGVINVFRKNEIRNIVWYLIGVSLIVIVYAWFQYFNIDFAFWEKPNGRMDMFSTIGNVNWYGAFLAGIMPLLIFGAFYNSENRKVFYFFCAVLLMSGSSLITTYSRAAFISCFTALIIGLFILLIIEKGRFAADVLKKAAIGGIILAVIIALYSNYSYFTANRYETGFWDRLKAGFSLQEHNVSQRLFVWRVTYEMFKTSPLFGVGPGLFKVEYLNHQKKYLDSLNNDPYYDNIAGNAKEAHNEYVQLAAETGIIGLICFLYFFGSVIYGGLKHIFYGCENRDEKYLLTALITSLLALMINALADFPLHVPCNAAFIFLLAGMIAAITLKTSDTFDLLVADKKNKKSDEYAENVFEFINEPGKFSSFMFAYYAICIVFIVFLIIMPFFADVYTVYGQSALKAYNFKAAVPYLEQAIKLNPAQGDAIYLLGTALTAIATSDGAGISDPKMLERGQQLLKNSTNYAADKGMYNNLGFIGLRKFNMLSSKTENALEKNITAGNDGGLKSGSDLKINEKKAALKEAIAYFEKAIGCEPMSSESLNNIGIAYMHSSFIDEREKNIETAKKYFEKSIKYNENFIIAYNNMGDLYSQTKEYDKALENYKKVIDSSVEVVINENRKKNIFNFNYASCVKEKARAFYQIGEIMMITGKYPQALNFYNAAYDHQKMPQVVLKIGLTYMKMGNISEGRRILEELKASMPPNSEIYKKASEYQQVKNSDNNGYFGY